MGIEFSKSGGWLTSALPPADPPVNVRVILLDGTEVAIELQCAGYDLATNSWRWEQVSPEPIPQSVFKGAHADVLPAHCTVAIALDTER